MKNWKVELTAEGKTSAEAKIQAGILHDYQMLLSHILRKCTGSYRLQIY